MLDDLLGYIDDEGLRKAMHYCAYQERCQQEVREKLYSLKFHKEDVEKIIAKLVRDNFINEERFAIQYAGGKFRISKWGRNKIKMALNQKKVSSYCVSKALNEIDKKEYQKLILKIISDQQKKIKESNPMKKNHRITQYLISRGFEANLVWGALKEED